MTNYYEILGLNSNAGILEIKSAFRQLAKIYHPDKNPNGIEYFSKILKAYETLSNPTLKATYDYKLHYSQAQTQSEQKVKTTKNWKFNERELKRRQYYNDHIKKYAKQTANYMAEAENKKNYNEFKYILFATPLAVLLFLLIMHLATRDHEEAIQTSKEHSLIETVNSTVEVKEVSDLKLGDEPYTNVFGLPKYDTLDNKTLVVKNLSGVETIVCLFYKNDFIRSFYLKENISATVTQLPKKPLFIYYCSGSNFDYSKYLTPSEVNGAFTKNLKFYKSVKENKLNSLNELTLLQGVNEGFEQIDERTFFKKD
ncbi:J domain-containing protein [Aurantibacillus circumpalustris]|uniref:J domain-containing protein n=1 Tax=Aurantibacillus circumpalustris TaxID=3036359 RepID=UPI00295BC3B9|nr:J domain-containing protein [Aurantibacillus circumpalustris]